MSKNNRTSSAIDLFSAHERLFRCPICHLGVVLLQRRSMVCSNAHCFDLSKQGYINWLTRHIQTKYDKQMFKSRRAIHDSGLFGQVDEVIAEQIKSYGVSRILDAGCGEGSHLSHMIRQTGETSAIAVGIDIAKAAVSSAAHKHPGTLWCVGDIGNLPFANEQFDCILNVLSPANYTEFRRVLTKGGFVIKVVPGPAYLQELRAQFYEGRETEVYANGRAMNLFQSHLDLLDATQVRYTHQMTDTMLEPLVQMTPLKWGATSEQIQKVLQMPLSEITIDLTIAVGRVRRP